MQEPCVPTHHETPPWNFCPNISSFRCAQVCGIPSLVSWEVWGSLVEVWSLLHDTYLGLHSKEIQDSTPSPSWEMGTAALGSAFGKGFFCISYLCHSCEPSLAAT